MRFEGEHAKKYGFKGGTRQKNNGCKGGEGGHQINSFKFCSDGICDNTSDLPESKNQHFSCSDSSLAVDGT